MPTALSPTSPAPLPEELLQYLVQYRVVVCTSCKYAIQPKAIVRHLKEIHHINRSHRQPYMKHVAKFDLAEHELVMQYQPRSFPVPLLPVHSGLQCRFTDCAYLCVTEKRMKHHWLSIHERQGSTACDWQTAPVQTFFKGNLLRYFTNTPLEKPAEGTASQAADSKRTEEYHKGPEEWTEPSPDSSLFSTSTSTTAPTSTTESTPPNDSSDNVLMHHYTTQTWQTLASDETSQQMWRYAVPELAYQYDYVMHALLACTALHMAHIHPHQHSELTIKARTHQNSAFPLFRAAVDRVENETCDAVLIFARLVAINAFALDERLLTDGEREDSLPNWLFFIRSGCTMLCEVWSHIGTGPMKCLASAWELFISTSLHPHQPLLTHLLAIPPPNEWPPEILIPYNNSAFALARTFSCLHALEGKITTLDVARFWPIENSFEFVEMLGDYHPGALILLAHYCVVLQRVGKGVWYLEGRAQGMLETIVRRLDGRWYEYIDWPLREVGVSLKSKEGMGEGMGIGSLALSGIETACWI